MFDIGFSELFLVGIVALLVLGPERLPRAARMAGLWVRRARAQWYSVKSELENELADEELRRSLQATRAELSAAQSQLREGAAGLQRSVANAQRAPGEPEDPRPAPPERREPGPDEGVPDAPDRREPGDTPPPQGDPDPAGPQPREPDQPPIDRNSHTHGG